MPNVPKNNRVRKLFASRLPIFLYCLVGVALLIQGVRYLTATKLMTYHLAVIATPWEGLSIGRQTMVLGLLKGFGAGLFCVGMVIILLTLIPFRAGSNWSRWATPVIAATYTGLLVYVTNLALLPGATPIAVTVALFGFVLLAAVSSFAGNSSGD